MWRQGPKVTQARAIRRENPGGGMGGLGPPFFVRGTRPCGLQFPKAESHFPPWSRFRMQTTHVRCLVTTLLGVAVSLYAADKPKPASAAPAETDPYAEVQPATETLDLPMDQRIRDQVLNHSHAMEFGPPLLTD